MLRITGGALRGRRFEAPRGDATRPTAEKVREAIGSALASRGRLEGARVLDLFAGTGALGFEALSRGAKEVLALERDREADRRLRSAAKSLGIDDRHRARRVDLSASPMKVAASLSEEPPFDLVFADPPYDAIELVPPLLDALSADGRLSPDFLAVVEYAVRKPPTLPRTLAIVTDYRYGDTAVALLARTESME